MGSEAYRIPKREQLVEMWVEPEGATQVYLFLLPPGSEFGEGEVPLDVLNQPDEFVVVRSVEGQVYCLNKRYIVRVRFEEPERPDAETAPRIHCVFRLHDGEEIEGTVREYLPPEHSRLIDYLNQIAGPFIRLELHDGMTLLLNKRYCVRAVPLE